MRPLRVISGFARFCALSLVFLLIYPGQVDAQGRASISRALKWGVKAPTLNRSTAHSENIARISEYLGISEAEFADAVRLDPSLSLRLENPRFARYFREAYPQLKKNRQLQDLSEEVLNSDKEISVPKITPAYGERSFSVTAERLKAIKVYNFLPSNETEFQNIFGRKASLVDQADIRFASASLADDASANKYVIARGGGHTSDTLLSADPSRADIYIFVGHNEAGHLVLPTKEKVSIRELSKRCALGRVICVFVSCKSNSVIESATSLGLDGKISVRESVYVMLQLAKAARSDFGDTVRFWNMAGVLGARNSKRLEIRMRVIEILGETIILALLSDDDD